MASGIFCGSGASRNPLKKSGLASPAVFSRSAFEPGRNRSCSIRLFKTFSRVLIVSVGSIGDGNRSTPSSSFRMLTLSYRYGDLTLTSLVHELSHTILQKIIRSTGDSTDLIQGNFSAFFAPMCRGQFRNTPNTLNKYEFTTGASCQ